MSHNQNLLALVGISLFMSLMESLCKFPLVLKQKTQHSWPMGLALPSSRSLEVALGGLVWVGVGVVCGWLGSVLG